MMYFVAFIVISTIFSGIMTAGLNCGYAFGATDEPDRTAFYDSFLEGLALGLFVFGALWIGYFITFCCCDYGSHGYRWSWNDKRAQKARTERLIAEYEKGNL